MIVEPIKDNEAIAEVTSLYIWERMRSGRFRVDKRLAEWTDEFKSYSRRGAKIPRDSHPLMAATRYAVAMIEYARPQSTRRRNRGMNYPEVRIT